MVSSTSTFRKKEVLKESQAQIVQYDVCPLPKFRTYLESAMNREEYGILSSISL